MCENELQRRRMRAELLLEKVEPWEQELLSRGPEPPCSGAGTWPPKSRLADDVPAFSAELERLRAELKEERQGTTRCPPRFQHEPAGVEGGEGESDPVPEAAAAELPGHVLSGNQRLEKALQQLSAGTGCGEPLRSTLGKGADIPYDIIATEILRGLPGRGPGTWHWEAGVLESVDGGSLPCYPAQASQREEAQTSRRDWLRGGSGDGCCYRASPGLSQDPALATSAASQTSSFAKRGVLGSSRFG